MIEWLVVAAFAFAGGGYLAYRAGRARGARAALPGAGGGGGALPGRPGQRQLERTVRDVRVDDILQHGGRDWLVEGVVKYDEDGHTWRAARGLDAPDERWFVVALERTGPTTVRVLKVAAGLSLTGYPPESLEHEGVSYKLAQRGTATTLVNGQVGELPGVKGVVRDLGARCRWWRYSAAGDKTLLVEQWGESYRALVGETVRPEDVDLLSGS
jgi:hypothetical protein